MNVVFPIERLAHYRVIAPVVDAALRKGWGVECWLDYGAPRNGLKGYLFPDVAAAPKFRHGRPRFRTFQNQGEFRRWLNETNADAVVSISPPPDISASQPSRRRPLSPIWLALQHSLDFLITFSPDAMLSADALVFCSNWWRNWMLDYFESTRAVPDRDAFAEKIDERLTFAGLTALDAIPLIDADEVRVRWKIPSGVPVVTLLPFPQGVGKASFWPRKIYGEPNRVRQVVNIVRHGRFEYLPEAYGGSRDVDVVKAIRRLCDREGAFLLVKSRVKTPIPAYTRQLADQCIYDEAYYPATIHEALAISRLCISYYSAAVIEAVAMGVPHLCITVNDIAYCGSDPFMLSYTNRFFNTQDDGVFTFKGVTTTVDIPHAVKYLDGSSLKDFRIDQSNRRRYVETFLSHDDVQASNRVIDGLEHLSNIGTCANTGSR